MEVQLKDKEIQPIQKEIAKGEPLSRPGKTISLKKEKRPWQLSVHIKSPKEERPGQTEKLEEEVPQLQLRRSTRIQKSNPKYANATLIEDNDTREPSNYEDVAQSK